MRNKLKVVTPVIILLMFLAGCASLTKDSYRTLASAKVTYEAVMGAAHDAWKAGLLSDEQVIPLIEYGNVFWTAYQAAVSALESYAINEGDGGSEAYLNAAIRAATAAFADLLTHWDMLQPIIDHARNRGTV